LAHNETGGGRDHMPIAIYIPRSPVLK
jgi:hypothetical protein